MYWHFRIPSPYLDLLVNALKSAREQVKTLAALFVRKKAANPLLPDQFISATTTLDTDADNTLTLTIIAQQAFIAAQLPQIALYAALALAKSQSISFYQLLTHANEVQQPGNCSSEGSTGKAKINDEQDHLVSGSTIDRLKNAVLQLNDASALHRLLESRPVAARRS